MKVTGIAGSRRKKGNTSLLVQTALKPLQNAGFETEMIFPGDYDIKSCTGCEGCRKTCKCVIDDDMHIIYKMILESDALIIGSPTYFYNVSSDIKKILDRLYCFEVFDDEDRSVWMGINEVLGGKYAAVIAVCEQHDEEDMGFTAEAMEKPLRALGYRITDTVKALGLFKPAAVLLSESELLKAEKAGEKLLKIIKLRKKLEADIKDKSLY